MKKDEVILNVLVILCIFIAVAAVGYTVSPFIVILAGIIAGTSIIATLHQYNAVIKAETMTN